ncbi:BatD family protein [Candidatus Sumerlaeota bacterium]|nr:BatD family protein [Candidatus Sumerlaeota bacterium]
MRQRVIPLVLCLSLLGVSVHAQAPTLTASVDPSNVMAGETTALTLTLSSPSNVQVRTDEVPALPEGIEITSTGTPSSAILDINGRRSYRTQVTWFLVPRREGLVEIPPITLDAGGIPATSDPVRLNVMPDALHELRDGIPLADPVFAQPQRLTSRNAAERQELTRVIQRHAEVFEGRLYLLVCADTNEPRVGQQVILSVYLVNGAVGGRFTPLERPSFVQPLRVQPSMTLVQRPEPQRSIFGNDFDPLSVSDYTLTEDPFTGEEAYVHLLRRVAFWPTQAGVMTIPPVQATSSYLWAYTSPTTGQRIQRLNQLTLATEPLTLHVRDLPPAPAGVSGSVPVGRDFRLTASMVPTELAYDEAATLTVRIEGEGLPDWFDLPPIQGGDLFTAEPPAAPPDPQTGIRGDRIEGSREFNFLVRFDRTGHLTLPPIEYPVFDLDTDRYRILRADPIVVDVSAQPSEPVREITNPLLRPMRGPDPLPLSTNSLLGIETHGFRGLRDPAPLALQTPLGWVLATVPPLFLIAGLVVNRRRARLQGEAGMVVAMRRRARRHLSAATRARRRGDVGSFHAELAAAIHGHLGDRLGAPTLGVPWAQTDEALAQRGVSESLRRRLQEILARTDFARFAPGAEASGEMDRLHEEAIGALRDLGREMSGKRGNGR